MPVDFPSYAGVSKIGVLPDLGVVAARSQGGLVITSRKIDPFWQGTLTTTKLEPWRGNNQHARFLSFLSRCVDLNLRVDWVPPRHRLPGAYTEASWPLVGDFELVDVPDQRTLTVGGLEEGLVLGTSDRIAVLQGDLVVHRWIAEDLVVSSAIAQDIPVTPRLPVGLLLPGAMVRLENPPIRFLIEPGSWSTEEVAEPSAISFRVMEALR